MSTLSNKDIVKKSVGTAIDICGSQVALAEKTGISQGAISKYIRGDALPRGDTAKKLSLAIGGKLKPVDFAPHVFSGL